LAYAFHDGVAGMEEAVVTIAVTNQVCPAPMPTRLVPEVSSAEHSSVTWLRPSTDCDGREAISMMADVAHRITASMPISAELRHRLMQVQPFLEGRTVTP
jgi:hypothetical protein